jgi:hypothetical protein
VIEAIVSDGFPVAIELDDVFHLPEVVLARADV